MELQMKMPDLATTGSDIRLVRWLAEPGQPVKRGQPLLEVETDKALSEVECIATGVLKEVRVSPDSPVSVGQVIAVFEVEGARPALTQASPQTPVSRPQNKPATAAAAPQRGISAPNRAAATPQATTQKPVAESSPRSSTQSQAMHTSAPAAPQSELRTSPAQSAAYERSFLLSLYERMTLIREFEERVKLLFLEGTMPGTIHQCQGQEATAVGVCAALRPDDWITSTFRGHGHALAKGLTPQELFDELFGARTGCCKGKGGSMHVGNMEKGMVPGIAIVAAGVPLAAGMALAFRMQKRPHIVACFFGDGAVAEGAFHEGVNMAALWKLPAIFVCENNLYGASTHISKVMKNPRISDRAAAYGFRGETVDGNDVLAVYEATRQAAADCRAGEGPVLLELLTYRRTGHSRRDPCHYQPKDEREAWFSRDPLDRYAAWLAQRGAITPADLVRIKARIEAQIDDAVEKAKRAALPSPEDLDTDVFA
jgi:pyruvate dehydrogenase E1 component alpha subunit